MLYYVSVPYVCALALKEIVSVKKTHCNTEVSKPDTCFFYTMWQLWVTQSMFSSTQWIQSRIHNQWTGIHEITIWLFQVPHRIIQISWLVLCSSDIFYGRMIVWMCCVSFHFSCWEDSCHPSHILPTEKAALPCAWWLRLCPWCATLSVVPKAA